MRLAGRYYDGHSSAVSPVEIDVQPDGSIWLLGLGMPRRWSLAETGITPRLGSLPRQLRFPDGAVCEVADNDALDEVLEAAGHRDGEGWVHRLEQNWGWALVALAAVGVAAVLMITRGIPALARVTATAISPELDRKLGDEALVRLDGWILEPTQLTEDTQAALRRDFSRVTAGVTGDWSFRLELRHSPELGANALALPSGIIIVTDELVELADDDNELMAVMAHEVGHVMHRHSLRMVLQQSVTALVSMAFLGDISTSSSMVAALPVTLVTARHSREFETEADDYAYAWLDQHDIPRRYFAAILTNLAATQEEGTPLAYLSSHPLTAERIARSQAAP